VFETIYGSSNVDLENTISHSTTAAAPATGVFQNLSNKHLQNQNFENFFVFRFF
jgi:hypothetical protein